MAPVPQVVSCDLSFYSYRHKRIVNPPNLFIDGLYKFNDCNDKKILTRIAHYESDWNPNSVNPRNKYAKGLYHILPSTRNKECAAKYKITDEAECALFIMKRFPSWYLTGYKPYKYDLSFKELI